MSSALRDWVCPTCGSICSVSASGLASCSVCGATYRFEVRADDLGGLPSATRLDEGTVPSWFQPGTDCVDVVVKGPGPVRRPAIQVMAGAWNCDARVTCDSCGFELALVLVADKPADVAAVSARVSEYLAENCWLVSADDQFCPDCSAEATRGAK